MTAVRQNCTLELSHNAKVLHDSSRPVIALSPPTFPVKGLFAHYDSAAFFLKQAKKKCLSVHYTQLHGSILFVLSGIHEKRFNGNTTQEACIFGPHQ